MSRRAEAGQTMEPQRQPRATMTDLIDRVMDKGVVVRLDLIVGLAGIPLIGISLHAAIAAMETMLQYGMMEDWDSRTRALEDGQADWRQLALRPGEQIQAELYGSYHDTEGIWRVWRPGRLLLTDQRLLLIRPVPRQTLFAAQVSAIAGLGRIHRENIAGGGRDMTCLALADGTLAALYTAEAEILEAWLADRLQRLGRTVTELSPADVGSLLGIPRRRGSVVAPLAARGRPAPVEVRLGGTDGRRAHLAGRRRSRRPAAPAAGPAREPCGRAPRTREPRGSRRARRPPWGEGARPRPCSPARTSPTGRGHTASRGPGRRGRPCLTSKGTT